MTPALEEATRLLRLAKRDSDTFEILQSVPNAHLAALGFHAQQAVEKALKAVAALNSIEIRRTHDLAALGQAIIDQGQTLPLDPDTLRSLNPFAVAFRYDDDLVPTITRTELRALLAVVLRWASRLIEQSGEISAAP